MYFFIKMIHVLGIALLAGVLLGQTFVLAHAEKAFSAAGLALFNRRMMMVFWSALVIVLGSGFYLGFSTNFFSSRDDRWLYYEVGLTGLLSLCVPWIQRRARSSISRRKPWGLWWITVILYVTLVYLPVAKPYVLNNLSLLWNPDSAQDVVEEIETIEE